MGMWFPNIVIPGQKSKVSPALSPSDDAGRFFHMVHLGDSSNDIWHSWYDGQSRTWSENKKIPGQKSKASPALAFYQQRLHMVHLGDSSNDIWHSWYDGRTWSTNKRIS